MHYTELHCRTNFSFLEGASHPDELVDRAVELGYAALAITDVNSLAGVVRAHGRAKDTGLKLLVGAEVTPVDAARVVLWATDRAGYGRLTRLLTVGRRRVEKGQCELTLEDVAEYSDGLLAGVLPDAVQPRVFKPVQMYAPGAAASGSETYSVAFSPGGAASCSQGASPWLAGLDNPKSPGGAT